MSHLVRSILLIAGVIALAAARVEAPPNVLEVVIGNGPHAGTYKPPESEVICMHAKKQRIYAATWRNLHEEINALFVPGAQGKNKADDPKAMSEAAIKVSNPDDPAAKYGDVLVAFGDPAKKHVEYNVYAAPLTLTIKGKGAEILFQGKTKDGIQLRVTGKCSEVDEM